MSGIHICLQVHYSGDLNQPPSPDASGVSPHRDGALSSQLARNSEIHDTVIHAAAVRPVILRASVGIKINQVAAARAAGRLVKIESVSARAKAIGRGRRGYGRIRYARLHVKGDVGEARSQ